MISLLKPVVFQLIYSLIFTLCLLKLVPFFTGVWNENIQMGRTRYKIYEPTYPHFVTCTILHWLPIFTRKQSVQIIIDCITFLQEKENLKLYAYVILENHLHMIVSSDDLHKTMQSFKQYTAKQRDYEGIKGLVEVERFW